MSRENSFSFLNLIFPLLFLFIFDSASSSCQTKCGEVEIPSPFGIGGSCYLNKWYEIKCLNESITFLTAIGKEVVNISFPSENGYGRLKSYGSVRIKNPITSSKGCIYEEEEEEPPLNLTGTPFYISYTNTLIAVGCNFTASLTNVEPNMVGCSSSCGSSYLLPSFRNETICDGIGCCQANIPDRLQQVVGVSIYEKTTTSGRECKVAFLTDKAYSFKHTSDPKRLHAKRYVTVELVWFVHTTNDSFRNSSECKEISDHNFSTDKKSCVCEYSADSNHTTCACVDGYRGNPYLPGGCEDIDECLENSTEYCPGCFNYPGGHHCKFELSKAEKIASGIGVSFCSLILIGGVYWLYKFVKRRRKINRKKKFFKRNGGLLLQQQLISTEGNVEKTRIFSSKELEKATENFSLNRVLGQGGQGTVYKGVLVDGGIVAVKKSKVVDKDKLEEFINEVVILSQINHRNIVKLLGCCLETDVPILVYEFISNGNLYEHLHEEFDEYTMITWEVRLRIAEDIAGALSYLHSAASFPIYHRDIKSTNIMLDEKYRAKVSDFGTSRSVTVDHTHLTTVVSGTVGYVDPEYFQSSQFTEKSDVYSFGVVLVELITGAKPISFLRSQENRTLATYFILAMKENRIDEVIDAQIKEESKLAQITAAAKLARRCLNLKGRKRPSMREVSMELERIRSSHGDSEPPLLHTIESDEEEETVEVNIGVVESWNDVAVTENIATSFVDAEPLFPRQTW